MKCSRLLAWIQCIILGMTLTSCCNRSSCDVWEDTKTATRYFGKGFGCLSGQAGNSRQVCCKEDFCCYEDDDDFCQFVPLEDDSPEGLLGMSRVDFPQPREMPGDIGSRLPGIDAFVDPSTDAQLAQVFSNVNFAFDSSQVKSDENVKKIRAVAAYMRSHPGVYLSVEGHCDERGPEAYNLALGSRRANAVRNMLISEGVDKDHVFTISYGKERMLVLDHHEEAHAKNRRVEFKVYQP